MIRSQIIEKIKYNLKRGAKSESEFTRRDLVDGMNGKSKSHSESLILDAFESKDLGGFLELLKLFGDGPSSKDGVSASEVFTYQYGKEKSALVLDQILSTNPENFENYYVYLGKTLETFGNLENVVAALESYKVGDLQAPYDVLNKTILKGILDSGRTDIIRYIASMERGFGKSFYEREISLDNSGEKSSIINYAIETDKKGVILDLILQDGFDVVTRDYLLKALKKWPEQNKSQARNAHLQKIPLQKILKAIGEKDMGKLGGFYKSFEENEKVKLISAMKEVKLDDGKLSHFYQSLSSSDKVDVQGLVAWEGLNYAAVSDAAENATNSSAGNTTTATAAPAPAPKVARVVFEEMTRVISTEESNPQASSSWGSIESAVIDSVDWFHSRIPKPTNFQSSMINIVASGDSKASNALTYTAMGGRIAKDITGVYNYLSGNVGESGISSSKSGFEQFIDISVNLATVGVDLYSNFYKAGTGSPAGVVNAIVSLVKFSSYGLEAFEKDQRIKANLREIQVRTDFDKQIDSFSQVNSYIRSTLGQLVLQGTSTFMDYNQNSRYIEQVKKRVEFDQEVNKQNALRISEAEKAAIERQKSQEYAGEEIVKISGRIKDASIKMNNADTMLDLLLRVQSGRCDWRDEDSLQYQPPGEGVEPIKAMLSASINVKRDEGGKVSEELILAAKRGLGQKRDEYSSSQGALSVLYHEAEDASSKAINKKFHEYTDMSNFLNEHINSLYKLGVVSHVMRGVPSSLLGVVKLAGYNTALAVIPMTTQYISNSGYDNVASIIDISMNSYLLTQSIAGDHKLHTAYYAMNILKGFYKQYSDLATDRTQYNKVSLNLNGFGNQGNYIMADELYNSKKVETRDQLYTSFKSVAFVVSMLAPVEIFREYFVKAIEVAHSPAVIEGPKPKEGMFVSATFAAFNFGSQWAYDQGYRITSYIAPLLSSGIVAVLTPRIGNEMIWLPASVSTVANLIGIGCEHSRADSVSSNSKYSKSYIKAFNATDASYKYDYTTQKYRIDTEKSNRDYISDKAEQLIKNSLTVEQISEAAKDIWDAIDEAQYMSDISGSYGNFWAFWYSGKALLFSSSYQEKEKINKAIYQKARKFADLKILLEVFENEPERKLELVDSIGKKFLGGDFRGFNQLKNSDKKLELFTKVMDFIVNLLEEEKFLSANPESLKDIIDSRLSYYIFENFIYMDKVRPQEFGLRGKLGRDYFDIAIDLVKLAYKVEKGEDLPYDRSQSKSLNLYNDLISGKYLTLGDQESLYTSILADKKGFDDIKAVVAHCKSKYLEINLDKDLHLYRFKNDYESFVSYINDPNYQDKNQYYGYTNGFDRKYWICIRDYQTKGYVDAFNKKQAQVLFPNVLVKENGEAEIVFEALGDFTVHQLFEGKKEYSYESQIFNLHAYYKDAQTVLVEAIDSVLKNDLRYDQDEFKKELSKLKEKVKGTEKFISELYGKPTLKYTNYEWFGHTDNIISKELGSISGLEYKVYYGYEKIVKSRFELSKKISETKDPLFEKELQAQVAVFFRKEVNNYYAVFENPQDVTDKGISISKIFEDFAKLDSTRKQSECLKKRELIIDAAKFVAHDIYKKYEEYKMIGSISPQFANCFDKGYKENIGEGVYPKTKNAKAHKSIFNTCLVDEDISSIQNQDLIYDIFDC